MSAAGGRWRKIHTRLWLHPGFVQLSDAEKVLVIYLLTGPQTNRIGLYRLSPNAAAEELGTSLETFRKRLATVSGAFGWLFDADARVLFIPSWWRWNPPANENVTRGSLKDLNDLPPCALMDAFARKIETVPEQFREAFLQGLREQMPRGFPNQEQDQEQDLKREQKPAALRAVAKSGKPQNAESNVSGESVNSAHIELARETLRFGNPNADIETLVDTFGDLACHRRPPVGWRRVDAVAALNIALAERRAQVS